MLPFLYLDCLFFSTSNGISLVIADHACQYLAEAMNYIEKKKCCGLPCKIVLVDIRIFNLLELKISIGICMHA